MFGTIVPNNNAPVVENWEEDVEFVIEEHIVRIEACEEQSVSDEDIPGPNIDIEGICNEIINDSCCIISCIVFKCSYDALPNLKPGRFKTRRVIDQAYHNFFLCENFFWCSGRVSS